MNKEFENLTNEELINIVKYLTKQLADMTGDRNLIKKLLEEVEKNCRNHWANLCSVKRKLKEMKAKIVKKVKV